MISLSSFYAFFSRHLYQTFATDDMPIPDAQSRGTTILQQFDQRLHMDIQLHIRIPPRANVYTAPEREHYIRIGSSILAASSTFSEISVGEIVGG